VAKLGSSDLEVGWQVLGRWFAAVEETRRTASAAACERSLRLPIQHQALLSGPDARGNVACGHDNGLDPANLLACKRALLVDTDRTRGEQRVFAVQCHSRFTLRYSG